MLRKRLGREQNHFPEQRFAANRKERESKRP